MELLYTFGCSNDNMVSMLWRTADGRLVYGECWDHEGSYVREDQIHEKIEIDEEIYATLKAWYEGLDPQRKLKERIRIGRNTFWEGTVRTILEFPIK